MTKIDIHPSVRRGDNMQIMGDLSLARGVEVGANVTFFPDARVGENTKIMPGAVIGRPPIRAGTTNRPIDSGDATMSIGSDCVIGANCVLYTNTRIGNNVLIGDLAVIREGCRLEDDTVVGQNSTLMHDVVLQARSRIHNLVHITGTMLVESDVFIGPSVSSINDNDVNLKRFSLIPFEVTGPRVRRFALIGTAATIGADIEIGMGAIIAPGAMAIKDVAPWTIVAGVPAREIRTVDEESRARILARFGLNNERGE
ncbi:MAG: DapH/DapD/GlmU-related protein [Chloroflexi bacterium]|nr:DapH/DapD/GlmU-related protein [Chloroflexota bacterium]